MLTHEQIAKEVGLSQPAVTQSLQRTAKRRSGALDQRVEEYRETIAEQLGVIVSETYAAWTTAQKSPNAKNTLYLTTNLKAMERLCKLFGVDAPVKIQADNTNRTVIDAFADAKLELDKESSE